MLRTYIQITLSILKNNKLFSSLSLICISTTIMFLTIGAIKVENSIGTIKPEKDLNRILRISGAHISENDKPAHYWGLGYSTTKKIVESLDSSLCVSVLTSELWNIVYKKKLIKHNVELTDYNYWEMMDFQFIEGRKFTREEFENNDNVIIVSENSFKHIKANKNYLNGYFTIKNKKYKVVGVVKNVPKTCLIAKSDIWRPFKPGSSGYRRGKYLGPYNMVIRMNSQSERSEIKYIINNVKKQVNVELKNENKRLEFSGPYTRLENVITNLDPSDKDRIFLTILEYIGIALLFMMVPALNIVGLNLTRIRERSEEIAVRKAMGASKMKLFKQFVFENVVITVIGGVLGVLLTIIVSFLFKDMIFGSSVYSKDTAVVFFRINYVVILWVLVASVIFGFLSGVIPAIKMSKVHPAKILKGNIGK